MTALIWDAVGARTYETGVDRCILFIPNGAGVYDAGYAWNGVTAVTESPSGAEANAMYANNAKYLNLVSAEQFAATLEAYTYPNEFAQFDGFYTPTAGVQIGQQSRRSFGLAYRTRKGNDLLGDDFGYIWHLVYGLLAAPSERGYSTVNESPEAITFSWELSSTPVPVTGRKPTSLLTVDSTLVQPANLLALENALIGTGGTDSRLPLPDEVFTMFAGALTSVTTVAPTFVAAGGTITIPTVTGVRYRRADTGVVVTGTVVIAGVGNSLTITAEPSAGNYVFSPASDDDWTFTRSS